MSPWIISGEEAFKLSPLPNSKLCSFAERGGSMVWRWLILLLALLKFLEVSESSL